MNLNPISPKVHRSLYNYAIKRFLENSGISVNEKADEFEISLNDEMGYSRLLDRLISEEEISDSVVDDFLLNELNYGRMKNVYISFIQDVSHLQNEENIIRLVKKLQLKGYANAENVNSDNFTQDLRAGISRGQEKLIHFTIDKNQEGQIDSIRFLLAEGFADNDGNESNNYYGVEINLNYKMLVIKLRNWSSESEKNYGLDTLHKRIQDEVKSTFHLSIPLATKTVQDLIYNMVNDLSAKVLDTAIKEVNESLEEEIEEQTRLWADKILTEGNILPPTDYDVIKKILLNNYYKIYMQNEFGVLKVGELKEKFGVNGYTRYVKFVDDTIGEARARSSDPKESLLDTSIYYDIKARLDQAKTIKMATIYWIESPGYEYLGTTFYTDVQERFKFVVLINFFNKEICDYVLRQINEYRRT